MSAELYKQLKEAVVKPMLQEKKEAIASSPTTNMTLHYDPGFEQVGEEGTPEFKFTLSVSSVGGKSYFRGVGDRNESDKLAEGIRLELRRALRKFDKHVQFIVEKYKLQAQ
jgi:hypothetical protein